MKIIMLLLLTAMVSYPVALIIESLPMTADGDRASIVLVCLTFSVILMLHEWMKGV